MHGYGLFQCMSLEELMTLHFVGCTNLLISLFIFLIALHNSNTCFSYTQAAEKAKYIDVFNSPSFRKCSTPDITVKENPALVKVVKGRICLFPQTF